MQAETDILNRVGLRNEEGLNSSGIPPLFRPVSWRGIRQTRANGLETEGIPAVPKPVLSCESPVFVICQILRLLRFSYG